MAAGKKKPVRWTIPHVAEAPPRPVAARPDATGGRAYPSAAELMARGPETRAWLERALRSIVRPAAVVTALGIGATGCADVGDLFAGESAPVFVHGGAAGDEPATLTPIGSPTPVSPAGGELTGGAVVMHPLPPDDPKPTGATLPPCPLPPLGGGAVAGEPPAVAPAPAVRPPAHPPAVRGRIRPIRPAPPPPPAVDPPTLDGDIAMVHPEPPPMPGGLRAVLPSDGGAGD